MKKLIWRLLKLIILLTLLSSSARATSERCVESRAGQVCFDSFVAGNAHVESMDAYWPLARGTNWKFHGDTGGHPYKLQVKVESPQVYEGQLAWPVDFAKNDDVGYWAPRSPRNLRWFVADYGQFLGARGDKRYNRHTRRYINRFRYESLTAGLPPYVLMPQTLVPNPENGDWVNTYVARHQYYSCTSHCTPLNQHNSWVMQVTNARIKVPYFGDEWVDAKRVQYVELSLPGKYADGLVDPYRPDREFACRRNGRVLYYRGVREDWFFVENLGPVLVLTRDIGLGADNECVYDVIREELVFGNSDTYIYLVDKGFEGYEPCWNY